MTIQKYQSELECSYRIKAQTYFDTPSAPSARVDKEHLIEKINTNFKPYHYGCNLAIKSFQEWIKELYPSIPDEVLNGIPTGIEKHGFYIFFRYKGLTLDGELKTFKSMYEENIFNIDEGQTSEEVIITFPPADIIALASVIERIILLEQSDPLLLDFPIITAPMADKELEKIHEYWEGTRDEFIQKGTIKRRDDSSYWVIGKPKKTDTGLKSNMAIFLHELFSDLLGEIRHDKSNNGPKRKARKIIHSIFFDESTGERRTPEFIKNSCK